MIITKGAILNLNQPTNLGGSPRPRPQSWEPIPPKTFLPKKKKRPKQPKKTKTPQISRFLLRFFCGFFETGGLVLGVGKGLFRRTQIRSFTFNLGDLKSWGKQQPKRWKSMSAPARHISKPVRKKMGFQTWQKPAWRAKMGDVFCLGFRSVKFLPF